MTATTATALGLLVAFGVVGAVTYRIPSLAPDEQTAMRWIPEHTQEGATFLLLSTRPERSYFDPVGEWFPVLSGRAGAAPPMGSEWLGRFVETEQDYEALQSCRQQEDVRCLEDWAQDRVPAFRYIYVPTLDPAWIAEPERCCEPILAALRMSPNYREIYAGSGASIFERAGEPR